MTKKTNIVKVDRIELLGGWRDVRSSYGIVKVRLDLLLNAPFASN